jgi:aminoglycoside 6-adenylyltransferase
MMTYESIETRVVAWAQAQPDVRAVIVVGSRARRDDHPADEWSDLDLVLFVDDVDAYATRADWLESLGEVWLKVFGCTGRGDPEWQALYAGGLKADFVFTAAHGTDATVQQWMDASPYQFVYQRGVRVLYPHTAWIEAQPITLSPPTAAEFTTLVNRVWLDVTKFARLWLHDDWWRAKLLLDGQIKQHVMTMMEWHACAVGGVEDTWHDGRHFSEWADPRAVQAAHDSWAAGLYPEMLCLALVETLTLFRWLAQETADELSYAYPSTTEQHVTEWLAALPAFGEWMQRWVNRKRKT